MIYTGKQMYSQVLCECGQPITNAMDGSKSAFIVGSCQNEACENFAVGMTIERSSMQILAVDATPYAAEGKRIYPVMADKDGKQVWPKYRGFVETDGINPTQDRHRFVSRPEIIECGLCGRGREEVIHFE